ncbi:MAG TPA: 3-oxoacyl-[acyl-carrier-protein] synthase III C-terminal domain-containing protein [Thermoleophilaceae bacterium]
MSVTSGAAGAAARERARRWERRGPVVSGVGVSLPPREYSQEDVLELLGLADDEFAQSIFARSGVRTRCLFASDETVRASLQARAAATEEHLFDLALGALRQLDFDPAEIGVLVTASYWSLGGPTLGHTLVDALGLPPSTDKYHLTGVGCASAVPLLRLAGQALRDRPGERALVIGAERVSGFMTRAQTGDERTKIVGSALFGDGCGAALLDLGPGSRGGPEIVATAVHQIPDSLDQVRFGVTRDDSFMRLGRELPALAEAGLPDLIDEFLGARGLDVGQIDHWLLHPGGRGILEGAQRGLGLEDEEVAASARVLADYGNTGTASSFFVLRETERMRAPDPGDLGLMVSIGPGVTIGLLLLSW